MARDMSNFIRISIPTTRLQHTGKVTVALVKLTEAAGGTTSVPGEDLSACTLYVSPLFPCAICADRIVRAGIRRVVAYCGHISPDWRASADEAERIFNQAGVECLFTMD